MRVISSRQTSIRARDIRFSVRLKSQFPIMLPNNDDVLRSNSEPSLSDVDELRVSDALDEALCDPQKRKASFKRSSRQRMAHFLATSFENVATKRKKIAQPFTMPLKFQHGHKIKLAYWK